DRRGGLPHHQSPDRYQLCAARPAGGAMSAIDAPALATRAIGPVQSKTRRWMRRYGLPALGALVIVMWIIIAGIAPSLSPYLPATVDVTARLRPPSWDHWLGTDVLGRDVFTRLIYGARISLTTGIIVVLVAAVIGTLVGGIAAYVRGRLEELIMRLTDLVLCF